MLRLLILSFVVALGTAQMLIDGHYLVANSSYNGGVLSISMSYTGSASYNLTILDQHVVQFLPGTEGISVKHEGPLEINTLFTNKDADGYWITIKIHNKPTGPFRDFLPAAINNRQLLIPTMRFPLHILGEPLDSLEDNPADAIVMFQVNSRVASLIVYGKKLNERIVMHWGDSKRSESTFIEKQGAKSVSWSEEESKYKPDRNKWGKGWLAFMPASSFAKAVRLEDSADLPQIVSVSLAGKLYRFRADHQPFYPNNKRTTHPELTNLLSKQLKEGSQSQQL